MIQIIDVTPHFTPEELISRALGRGLFNAEVWRLTRRLGLVHDHNLDFNNGITLAGLSAILNVMFGGAAATTAWSIFPIAATNFSALQNSDTMASHAGWQESVAYQETARPTWVVGPATNGTIASTSQAVMTFNADGTQLQGLGAVGNATKGGTTGTLWATGVFPSVQGFNNGDVLKVNYNVAFAATN